MNGHHIWCNQDPRNPASECSCNEMHEKYPMDRPLEEMMTKHFPDAIMIPSVPIVDIEIEKCEIIATSKSISMPKRMIRAYRRETYRDRVKEKVWHCKGRGPRAMRRINRPLKKD